MAKHATVKTQMPATSVGLKEGRGEYDRGKAPFDKPHSLGNGGIPLKFYETVDRSAGSGRTRSGSGVPQSNLGTKQPTKDQVRKTEKVPVPRNRK